MEDIEGEHQRILERTMEVLFPLFFVPVFLTYSLSFNDIIWFFEYQTLYLGGPHQRVTWTIQKITRFAQIKWIIPIESDKKNVSIRAHHYQPNYCFVAGDEAGKFEL